ncbi:U2 snRNP-associated SURP motif-containing protein [Archocentrus centrarchus]|uniref:U2 snRNP-associated SURP motif-containing protein n=1 Tax=Archocentrus centrarchus TaxID=63155 RepID=UPI0011EA3627|nr:U2 snRNP-associated SURP motif-containing protein-like [Archocentrus centrarchus]XP_030601677.1 U2 snRNP-associated SURP motif-containing protein-like [Archocentrus centrarchus]XP_030601678.1 U2 snRNP-associated SURP motif-containing protein-like [Archocentrus centrarchus]XP_030601679.1 U2 snRNP-associated SURP motif-containing protein-like [Archocentrus centrarchus]XP_030601680.1 U2 snRNP-associated SURP motif-containing protein-like [Archocentrus centrarchus]
MADRKGKPAPPMKTLTKKEQEELKKKEEEKAAEVFEEFLASFETSEKSRVKTFVRGGIVNATKEEEAAEVKKNKLYQPATKFIPVSQHVSSVSAESKKSTYKRKTEEKKKSNLELFKEELKLIQEEREERHKRKKNDSGGGVHGDLDLPLSGRSMLYDDLTVPTTTNLYINCISPKMNEEMLCKEFCKYGPLASVKIMWPRTDEERCRTSNRAFVAFMTRKDAERALAALDGKVIMGFEMKLGWGKPARIPPQPLYTPVGVRATPPPPSGLPFNAQPRDRFRNDFTKPLGMSKKELDKTLSEAVVKVVIPTERNLLFLIHRMIEFVVREGPVFEAIIMNKEKNNPDYRFLFDNKSQDHVYYRWRLFSILQGESPTEWRTSDFRMFRGGSLWRPPSLNSYSQRGEERAEVEDDVSHEEEVKKGQLRAEHRQRLEMLLKELTPSRDDVANAMLFCLDRADAAEEVVGHVSDSFSLLQTSLQKMIARLYLVSDILHNSCAKVAGASYYRKYFETKLPQIFGDLNTAHKNIQARLQAELFKQKVMSCFRAWEDWAIYPEPYLIHLQNVFLGFAKAGEEPTEIAEEVSCDIDGAPMDSTPIDGVPLDRTPVDDLDGCPMGWDPLDGVPVDDIDGVPLGVTADDIDGMPLDEGSVPLASVPLSKWENMSDTGMFSQAKSESKWDTVAEQDSDDEANVSGNSQDGDEDSESDSSADSCSLSNYDSAVFQSSLRSFQMSESKRKRLRELEVKVMKIQDELESGKRQKKSGMSIQQQVEHYRNKLLQKEFQKDEEKNERSISKSKERSKDDRRSKEKSKRNEDGERRRSNDSGHQPRKSRSISPLKMRSPKWSKRSRSPSPDRKAGKSRSRSPHRSHKKAKKSKH